jgi:hypothetical protein
MVGHPARWHPFRRPQSANVLQGIGLLPGLVVWHPRQQYRYRAPAGLGGEQTVHPLQCREW